MRGLTNGLAIAAIGALGWTAMAGPDWLEPGDAPRLPPGQTPGAVPGGPLNSIGGMLGATLGPAGPVIDMEDVYRICITDPVNFQAWTECPGAVFDAQLWLFSEAEFGLLANDNNFFINPHAQIQPPATDGTGQIIPAPGIYYIAITADGNQALSPSGPIFNFIDPFEVSGPDGPGGGNPIDDWNGGGPFGLVDYIIHFAPGTACVPGDEVDVLLAELRIADPDGADAYAEVSGPFGTPLLDMWYIVLGNDGINDGVILDAIDLSDHVIPPNGRFLIAADGDTYGQPPDLLHPLNFASASSVTHGLVIGFTGVLGQVLDANGDGILDNEPWDVAIDCLSLLGGDLTVPVYCPATVGPDGRNVVSHAFRCEPFDAWQVGPFEPIGLDTPGFPNVSCVCEADCAPEGGDGTVDIQDLLQLLSVWGSGDHSCDFNFDGAVDIQDLLTLLSAWGDC